MRILYIFGSVTLAVRAKKLLEGQGLKGAVKKAPAGLYDIGCNYCLEVAGHSGMYYLDMILSAGVKCAAAFYYDGTSYKNFYRRDGAV